MIKNTKALSLSEVEDTLSQYPQIEENNAAKNVSEYIKKFVKIKPAKANELKKGIQELNLHKLKEKHISKIIDIMPEDADDLKKVFVGEDFSLETEEINLILEKIKSIK